MVHVSQKVGFVLSACRKGERLATAKGGGGGWGEGEALRKAEKTSSRERAVSQSLLNYKCAAVVPLWGT